VLQASSVLNEASYIRWNILSALDNIGITTGPKGQATITPFFSHPSAAEALAEPPLSRVRVCIYECEEKRGHDMYAPPEYRYQPPAAFTVNNKDGRPITLGQFVTQLHAYLGSNMAEIVKAKGDLYGKMVELDGWRETRQITYGQSDLPENIGLYFKRVWTEGSDSHVTLQVSLIVPSVEAKAGCEWKADAAECKSELRKIIDQCDTNGEDRKQGGRLVGDCLTWRLDPNAHV
jgi:hypothetical protein